MSDKIESVLRETRKFEPPASFANANVAGRAAYDALAQEARDDWEGFWRRHGEREILWSKPFTRVYDGADAPAHKWFADGELNISANCLDRHLQERGDQPAIVFETDGGETEVWTYRKLHERVCLFCQRLARLGPAKGRPRYCLYAHAPRGGCRHAGVRAFGGDSFRCLWRFFGKVFARPHCRRGGKVCCYRR